MKPLPDLAPAAARGHTAGDDIAKREVHSEELFRGERVVLIRHADAIYVLRRTSNGKLLLTK